MSISRLFLVLAAAGLALVASPAYAHGFGTRYDLPVPLWLYVIGAGAAVGFSFLVVGLFVKGASDVQGYPRLNLLRWSFGRALVHPVVVSTIQALSVGLLVLVIVAGIWGTETDTLNFAPTMVWVIWWVGTAYASALIGNVWGLVNPWNITFQWAERLYTRFHPEGDIDWEGH